ncbi:YajG family lipoprotein [Leptospira sanjuanensis]|uniref:YajG family lipoprotein n=1 Tax=Leptospira sanjuanensis TaxID=2879643 RepID=UPI001EE859E7|nr:YajG family lipoprotein [Leptospira sanjuanensis]MCG6170203.1 YajG family lipoprotein [Leptospira sanjuanensis]
MIKLTVTAFALLFVSLFVSNCAFSEGRIKPNYPNPILNEKIKSKTTLVFRKSDDSPVSIIDGFNREGIRKNSLGMETANMFTDPKGPDFIKNILTLELKNSGIDVVENSNSTNVPQLEVELIHIFMEPEVGFFAGDIVTIIDADVILKKGGKVYKRRFKGIGESRTIVWVDHFYEISLKKSLEDFVKKSVPEIIKVLNEES